MIDDNALSNLYRTFEDYKDGELKVYPAAARSYNDIIGKAAQSDQVMR